MDASQSGGEVRRLHIIYFLSRKGRIEHPHLIRVHHLSRNGVRLQDVKRWLSELRGRDMPESFAWSYKRKYKTDYVWQDLLDEDLITPISDNEYVLKGSEISSTFNNNGISFSHGEKKISVQKEPILEDETKGHKTSSKERNEDHHKCGLKVQESKITDEKMPKAKMNVSTQPPCEIQEESPPFSSATSTLTNDSFKLEDEKLFDATKQEEKYKKGDKFEYSSPFYSDLAKKKNKKTSNKVVVENNQKISTPTSSKSLGDSSFDRNRSSSSGASHIFRNLITCGAVETNDSAMVTINRRNKSSLHIPSDKQFSDYSAKIVKGKKLGGSERIFGTPWNHQEHSGRKSCDAVHHKKREFSREKTVYVAAYKPVNGPNCSQCGKQFRPEKLHKHMKSCRGMKAFAKGGNPHISTTTDAKKPGTSMNSSYWDSISGYFLTNN